MRDPSQLSRRARKTINDIASKVHATPPTGEVRDLPCPVCGRFLKLKNTMFGRCYLCPHSPCGGKRGARADGTPTNAPRKTAYEMLDTLEIDK